MNAQHADWCITQVCKGNISCPLIDLHAQAEALRGDLSVVQTLVEAAPDAATNDVKALLGRMMFSGLAMDKKVRPSPPCWAFPGTWGPPLLRLVDKSPSTLGAAVCRPSAEAHATACNRQRQARAAAGAGGQAGYPGAVLALDIAAMGVPACCPPGPGGAEWRWQGMPWAPPAPGMQPGVPHL